MLSLFSVPSLVAVVAMSLPLLSLASPTAPAVQVQREVCAAAIQTLLGKPYIFLRSATADGLAVQQFRSANGAYANSCYLKGDAVIWRTDKSPSHSAPGRWRTHALDERLTWQHDGKTVTVDMRYSDGSGSPKSYSVESLRKSSRLPQK